MKGCAACLGALLIDCTSCIDGYILSKQGCREIVYVSAKFQELDNPLLFEIAFGEHELTPALVSFLVARPSRYSNALVSGIDKTEFKNIYINETAI